MMQVSLLALAIRGGCKVLLWAAPFLFGPKNVASALSSSRRLPTGRANTEPAATSPATAPTRKRGTNEKGAARQDPLFAFRMVARRYFDRSGVNARLTSPATPNGP